MSFEAMRLVPCRAASALRSVAFPAGNPLPTARLLERDTHRVTMHRTPPNEMQSQPQDVGQSGVEPVAIPHRPLPLRSSAALRLFAIVLSAVSAVAALASGFKDELEQRRRFKYRDPLHA
jgi:hypothetical protein